MDTGFPPLYWSSSTSTPPPEVTCLMIREPFTPEKWESRSRWADRCHRRQEPVVLAVVSNLGSSITVEAWADAGTLPDSLADSFEALFEQHRGWVRRQDGSFRAQVVNLMEDQAIRLAQFIVNGIRNDRRGRPPW